MHVIIFHEDGYKKKDHSVSHHQMVM